nr:MAG TPA: hypothetical protein [Caudoviricetes sp.]
MLGINIPFVIQKIQKKPLKEAVESGGMIIRSGGGVKCFTHNKTLLVLC